MSQVQARTVSIDPRGSKEAFRLFDTASSGTIDMRLPVFQVKKAEINQMIIDLGKDESKSINLNEFIELLTDKMNSRDPRRNEEILKNFQLFDDDNTGKMSF
ncbi:centrin [Plasmopara halstedii]|uniref:Centrin n=1 Tax=Plasmopara halstedii TaxID=4781 RepID=A0A0P1ABV9_PLAHL|nr:centrin [Plasmopara halstedii]CEG38071.1 centrin [Plasmopara halstedii]|eukprot:XP_024574440.1 centrin [Plasmopara halstedii]